MFLFSKGKDANEPKAHAKRPELIPVSLAWRMPSSIATPPWAECYVSGTHLYTGWRETKGSKVPCLRKERDVRCLNPGPPDPNFEVF